MNRVPITPMMFRWARERASLDVQTLKRKFAKYEAWEAGERSPTLKQLETFADIVHVPMGYLFLAEPPEESLPIPDLRTVGNRGVMRPSPELLDTIDRCLDRQEWYRDYAVLEGLPSCDFIGSTHLEMTPQAVAGQMRETLAFEAVTEKRDVATALRTFIAKVEEQGVLVMINGVVDSNTRRPLNVEEFRGFALADSHAPLIFINGADAKVGQMFTLAHELAHLYLNQSGVMNPSLRSNRSDEIWCNAVAAELLVPAETLFAQWRGEAQLEEAVSDLADHFHVSKQVILLRLLHLQLLDQETFGQFWHRVRQNTARSARSSGGDFYRTTLVRVGKRFTEALVSETLSGRTLYRDAFRMLGVSKSSAITDMIL